MDDLVGRNTTLGNHLTSIDCWWCLPLRVSEKTYKLEKVFQDF